MFLGGRMRVRRRRANAGHWLGLRHEQGLRALHGATVRLRERTRGVVIEHGLWGEHSRAGNACACAGERRGHLCLKHGWYDTVGISGTDDKRARLRLGIHGRLTLRKRLRHMVARTVG